MTTAQTEYPSAVGEGALRARLGDQGAPGHRPGARQVGVRGAGHPALGAAGRQRAGRQGDRQRRGQRAEQRRAGPVHARGGHRLRRRGPDRQAHPAARAGACVPDPQAHQPHHGDRREPPDARTSGRQRSASATRSRRAQGSKAAAAKKAPASKAPAKKATAKKAPAKKAPAKKTEASDEAKGGSE